MSNITIISNTTLQNHKKKKWKNLARNCKLWPLLADYLLPLANVYLPTQNKKKKYGKKLLNSKGILNSIKAIAGKIMIEKKKFL